MRKLYDAAHVYMILGVVSGLYYREFTKADDFTGDTQLALMHTHLLSLGMMGFLIVLALAQAVRPVRDETVHVLLLVLQRGHHDHRRHDVRPRHRDRARRPCPRGGAADRGPRAHPAHGGLILLVVLLGKRLNESTGAGPAEPEQEKETAKSPV